MGVGDVVNEDGRAVDDANGQVVELGEPGRRTVERDDVFEVADLLRSDRRHDVLLADRVDDVLRRKPVGLQLLLIDVDLDLQDLAAIGRRNRRAGDRGELRADEVLAEVEDLRLRQRSCSTARVG